MLPSLSEPWGLVVNEAASTGLPLLVSNRAGCAPTLVPDREPGTGADSIHLTLKKCASADMAQSAVRARACGHGRAGRHHCELLGPERFAHGTLEALELAERAQQGSSPLILEKIG